MEKGALHFLITLIFPKHAVHLLYIHIYENFIPLLCLVQGFEFKTKLMNYFVTLINKAKFLMCFSCEKVKACFSREKISGMKTKYFERLCKLNAFFKKKHKICPCCLYRSFQKK